MPLFWPPRRERLLLPLWNFLSIKWPGMAFLLVSFFLTELSLSHSIILFLSSLAEMCQLLSSVFWDRMAENGSFPFLLYQFQTNEIVPRFTVLAATFPRFTCISSGQIEPATPYTNRAWFCFCLAAFWFIFFSLRVHPAHTHRLLSLFRKLVFFCSLFVSS